MNLGHDVLAVDENMLIARRPERHMQHGPVLAHIDLCAREHRVPPRLDAARPGEAHEQANGLVRDAVLRIVEEKPGGLDGETFGAPCVAGKQGAQMLILDALVVPLKRFPLRQVRQRRGRSHGPVSEV